MASLLYVLFVLCSAFNVKTSAVMIGNSSFTRTSYLYYLDSGLPSTWYNNNPVIMDEWKMRVFLVIKHYSRSFGFYVGFYCTANCSDYLFSVVAVGEGSHDVVWSANMDNPVGENASLQLTRDNGLVLQDSDGTVVWSANTSGKSVEGMNLTGAGNLVLFDKQGATVWQSFDHPTDALLTGQSLYKGQKLVANYFSTLWRDGPFFATVTSTAKFSAFFNTSDGQSLIYYQLKPDKDSRNRSGLQYVEDKQKELHVRYGTSEATFQLEHIEYLKLDMDGHLRTYHYNTTKGSRTAAVDLVTQECPIDPDQYDIVEVRNVSHSIINISHILIEGTVDRCTQACLQNCNCSVVVFINQNDESPYGNCYMPSEILSTGEENQTTNGSKSATFVKVLSLNGSWSPSPPGGDIPVALPSKPKKNLVAIISGSTAGGIVIILLILTSLVMLRKNGLEDEEDNIKQVPGMPMYFSFEVLKEATENFKETLGSGGFGSVFKGVLADGTRIAVKRLDKMSPGKREFLAEVETIGSLHHFNLVKLVGFCAEKSCRLLVYEYMTNGSLDNWIFIRDQAHSLDWQTRKKIVLDVAKGLAYLHEDCRQKIVHLDIKPHNILLDEYFNAKISDFGLSTLIDRNESQVLTTLRGTPGYLAPEWQQLKVTVKVDVYSFGIVLLEIVSKRRNVDRSRSDSSFHLLKVLQKKAEEDQLIDIVEDLDEDMENNREEVVRMIRVGAWCLQNDYTRRPSMSTVVKVLEGVMEVDSNIVYMFSHALASTSAVNDHITVAPQASTLSAPR